MTSADRPSPAALAAHAARHAEPQGDPAQLPELVAVAEILDQVAALDEAEVDGARLATITRQSELLAAAHDRLSEVLKTTGQL